MPDVKTILPSVRQVVYYLIKHGPGRTEKELAEASHGRRSPQQDVEHAIRWLLDEKLIFRDDGRPARFYVLNNPC